MKKIIISALILTWVIGLFYFRLIGLDKSPVSLGFDEAALGYNAYSLLLTGKDEYGIPHPLTLRSFNDFKPALYSYITIPFIHYFGLTQSAVRDPSAILGVISLIFLLLIFKQLSKASWLASFVAVGVISFFPWRLHFSRVALEANISMAFFTGMVWCLLNFKKNLGFKIGAIFLAALSIYSYHSSRIAAPILLFLFLVDPISFKAKRLLKRLWPIFAVFILSIPILLETQAGLLLTRLNQTNIFNHFYPFTPKELIFMPNVWSNIIANPLYYLGELISGHLFAYISPKNLSLLIYPGVIKSDQVISGTGMLGFIGGFLFIFGLARYFKKLILDEELRILTYWIVAGLVPAAITWEWFYPIRSLNIYPAIDIVAGLGLIFLFQFLYKLKNKLLVYCGIFALGIILLSGSIYNLANEYGYGPWDTSGEFQPGGFKEGGAILSTLSHKYKTVYLDSDQAQSYEMFWFYMKYPPELVQQIAGTRNAPGVEGPGTLNFGNFVYEKYDWSKDKLRSNFVFWTSSEVKEDEINAIPGTKLHRIQGPFGYPMATIITKD